MTETKILNLGVNGEDLPPSPIYLRWSKEELQLLVLPCLHLNKKVGAWYQIKNR